MPKLICLDSNIVIWGVKGEATVGQEQMVDRAQNLLRTLDEEKAVLMIPSPVIAEILMPVPPEQHGAVLAALSKRFRIPPFDTAAASLSASIRQRMAADGSFKKQQSETGREAVKFDIQIVAIARLHGVSTLYSNDVGLLNTAACAGVKAMKLPEIAQPELFTNEQLPRMKPLKITGTLTEVLKVAVRPATKQKGPPTAKKKAAVKKAAPKKRAKPKSKK